MLSTSGIEEEGRGQGFEITKAKNDLRNIWRKLVESEERLLFFKKMVLGGLQVREIEHLGEEINNKFKSEQMKGAKSDA